MASYNELNALIDAYIYRNGVQAITGQILNGVLRAMVSQLGRGYTIMGAATPATDPGTPDSPESWFASGVGTYMDFNGLQVVPGELALLCYTPSGGWTKETIYEGFQEVQATIDGNVGTPSVGVSYANGVLSFDFRNMKGNPGDPAGFGTIGADITGGVGTPGVSVESSGPATAKNLQFHFTNLKGETGVTSVVATVDNTTGTPTCTVSLVGQQLTLAFSGLKGAQGDTGSSVDYPFTIVNNLTTDDATQALSAAQGVVLQGEITQLEHKVNGIPAYDETITIATTAGTGIDTSTKYDVDLLPGGRYYVEPPIGTMVSAIRLFAYGEDGNAVSFYYGQSGSIDSHLDFNSEYPRRSIVPISPIKKVAFYSASSAVLETGDANIAITKDTTPGLEDRVSELEETRTSVVDSLNSTSSTDALSAKQGKILNDKLENALFENKTINAYDSTEYPLRGGAIDNDTLKWRGSSYKFILIPVEGASSVTMKGSATKDTRYIFLKSFTAATSGVSAVSDFSADYSEVSELPQLLSGETKTLPVPSDAIWLYFYAGTGSGYVYRPDALSEVVPKDFSPVENEDDVLSDQLTEVRQSNIIFPSFIGELPKEIATNEEGYEIIQSCQAENMRKKARQFINLVWTPKRTIVGRTSTNNTYTENTEVESVPYGNNDEDWKRVGIEVSLHTFMTAVNNKYSLLYTERVYDDGTKSAWGRTYDCQNGGLYYGVMCCGFTAFVSGRKGYYLNNPYHNEWGKLFGELVPLATEGEVCVENLKVGDVANNDGHDFVIYNIKRDGNGNITNVTYAESNASAKSCHLSSRTLAQFKDIIFNEEHSHADNPFTLYRDTQLNNNYIYEPSQYVKASDDEPEPSPVYNNEICTYAGDKATFSYGKLVVLNYDLDGLMDESYTKIRVYKDGELYGTYTIGDANYSYNKYVTDHSVSTTPQNVIADMNDHALVLGDDLPSGKYTACLATSGNTESSNVTSWEIVGNPADMTIVRKGDDNYTVTSLKGKIVRVVCGSQEGAYKGREAAFFKVAGWDYIENRFNLHPKKLLGAMGLTIPSTIYLRVSIEGEYGCAPTPLINLSEIQIQS